MSRIKKLAGETVLYGLSSILGRLLSFIFLTPYLTRQFSQASFGIHADIYSWTALLSIFFTFRIEIAFFRYATEQRQQAGSFRAASTLVLISSLVLGGAMFLFTPTLARLIEYPNHANYIQILAALMILDSLALVPFTALRLAGRALRFASLKFLHLGLHLGLILFFFELGPHLAAAGYPWAVWMQSLGSGVEYVFLANLLASAFIFVLLLPIYIRHLPTWRLDPVLMRRMMRYATPLAIAGLAGAINEIVDRQLLKWLLEGSREARLAQIGIYGACYKIAVFMSLFVQAFNYAAEPFFFLNAHAEDSKPLYAKVTFLFSLVGSLVFVTLTLYSDWVRFFLHESYWEGMKVVPVLLLANLCLGLYSNVSVWYKLTDRTYFGGIVGVIGAIITLLTNFLLIPHYGYMGAAWATLCCYASMLVLAYIGGQYFYAIPYRLDKILGYLAFALGIYIIDQPIRAQFEVGSGQLFVVQSLLLIAFVGVILWLERNTWRPFYLQLCKKYNLPFCRHFR